MINYMSLENHKSKGVGVYYYAALYWSRYNLSSI